MAVVAAVHCAPSKFGVTVVTGDPDQPTVLEEHLYEVPASYPGRGEQLQWLYESACDLVKRHSVDLVVVRKAEGQLSTQERHETEGVVRLAAHHKNATSVTKTKEQVRAAYGVPRGRGAYDSLLTRPEVKSRSNADRRHLLVYASTGLRGLPGL